jgi:predicted short-subunit dehydrogenase-like oxidoreductase (DUF2520 family)
VVDFEHGGARARVDAATVSSSLRVIGPGRAGEALRLALGRSGWRVLPSLGRGDDVAHAAHDVDLLLLTVPDGAVTEVAAAVEPSPTAVVAHVAGSLTLDVLATHPRRASIHPLVPLATPEAGAAALQGAWLAVAAAGDTPDHADAAAAVARNVVADLGGTALAVDDGDRAAYHAAACMAANHLVALLGQVQRVAATASVPLEAYLDLARAALEGVAELGPAAALTGPVARGDWATVERHLAALDPGEHAAYRAMADAAARMAGTGPSPWQQRR